MVVHAPELLHRAHRQQRALVLLPRARLVVLQVGEDRWRSREQTLKNQRVQLFCSGWGINFSGDRAILARPSAASVVSHSSCFTANISMAKRDSVNHGSV